MKTRRCGECDQHKPLSQFPRNHSRPLGRDYRCRVCMRARVAAWSITPRGKARTAIARAKYSKSAKGKAKRIELARKPKHVKRARQYREQRKNTRAGVEAAFRSTLRPYGLDVEEWARMYNSQNRQCAGCIKALGVDRHTHVDHCHTTGRVRALLCSGCNNALGRVRDDPVVLRKLADYVEAYR